MHEQAVNSFHHTQHVCLLLQISTLMGVAAGGCCRYDQILQAVLTRLPPQQHQDVKVKAEGDLDDTTATSTDPEGGLQASSPSTMVWWAFLQLLQERYIERAPPCNLPPLQPKSAAPVRAKKAAPKPGEGASRVTAQHSAVQHA